METDVKSIPIRRHSALTDVSTPHSLADLVAAVCSETEAKGFVTKEFFVPVSVIDTDGSEATIQTYPSIFFDAETGYCHFPVFKCPHDFTSLTDCSIVFIGGGSGTFDWTVTTCFAAIAGLPTQHTDSVTDDDQATANLLLALVITEAFTGLEADDYVGVKFTLDARSSTATLNILGLVFKYS